MICALVFLTAASTLRIQVLVKSLFDRGFLFLLSSAQMVESKGAKKLLLSSHNSLLCQLNTYLFPSVRVQCLKKKVAVLFSRAAGASGEKPASIIHLSGVKDGCQVL